MDLLDILEQQARCANRLWDPDEQMRYLALQKELNKMAEASTLVVNPGEHPEAVGMAEFAESGG